MYKLSPSKLNVMEDCPCCFWLMINKNIKRPSTPLAGVLTKMDSVIKNYFERYCDKGVLPPIIEGKVRAKLASSVPKTLYYCDGDVSVSGVPDEYLDVDGFIIPLDHKVSRGKSAEETHKAYILQLDFYTFLLNANNFKTRNEAYLAYYYPCDCDVHDGVDFSCYVVKIKTDPDRAKKIIEKAVKLLDSEMPAPNPECDFCRYRSLKI